MIDHPLTTACQILWPSRDQPHPASRLTPWEAACWVAVGWNRRTMAGAPLIARRALCKIVVLEYGDPEFQEFLTEWACAEAPNWWPGLFRGCPADKKMLATLFADFTETRRI
ncbi:MAG: hypothetical protein IT406_02880 [Candidatus Yanofskybacteria bacterium]|nr:hypothetical protein [Candidatus Yanofskybacteria bacterium]